MTGTTRVLVVPSSTRWGNHCRPQPQQVERLVWVHDLQTYLPRSTQHLGLKQLDRIYLQHFASYEWHTYMYNENHSLAVEVKMKKGVVTV